MGRVRGRAAAIALAAAALAVAGCGGGSQDDDEPRGEFTLDVLAASFPLRQTLSQTSTLALEVRNTDDRPLPDLAVTIETVPDDDGDAPVAFAQAEEDPRLADPDKPVWIVDSGPEGGTTAATNTWSIGEMFPGQTETLEWRVTAVRPGSYTVNYNVSPGLDGNAVPANGQDTSGSFTVLVSDEPTPARVRGDGEVVRGEAAGGAGVGD